MAALKFETQVLMNEINFEEQNKYFGTVERKLKDVSEKLSEVFHQKHNDNFKLLDAKLDLMEEIWGEDCIDIQISLRTHVLQWYGEIIDLLEQIRSEIIAEPVPVKTYTPGLEIENGVEP